MAGWTEYDLAQLERRMTEKRLQREGMMPKIERSRPIRSALASALMATATRLSAEQGPATPRTQLTVGAAES